MVVSLSMHSSLLSFRALLLLLMMMLMNDPHVPPLASRWRPLLRLRCRVSGLITPAVPLQLTHCGLQVVAFRGIAPRPEEDEEEEEKKK